MKQKKEGEGGAARGRKKGGEEIERGEKGETKRENE